MNAKNKILRALVILAACTAVSLPAQGLLAMDVDLWQMPQFPGSSIIWREKPIEVNGAAARAMHIRCQAERKQALDFYANTLTGSGWSEERSEIYFDTAIRTFAKAGRFLHVVVLAQGYQQPLSDIYLVASQERLSFCVALSESLLKKELADDVSGKDIREAPRFPGSRRRVNVFLGNEAALAMYEANARPADIEDFFRRNFKALGFSEEGFISAERMKKIHPEMDFDAVRAMSFTDGKDTLQIFANIIEGPGVAKRSLIIIAKNMADEFRPVQAGRER